MSRSHYDAEVVRREIAEDPEFAQAILGGNLCHVREIVRQQILGDRELLQDIDAGRERRAHNLQNRALVVDRLWFCERLAGYVGLVELRPVPVSGEGS